MPGENQRPPYCCWQILPHRIEEEASMNWYGVLLRSCVTKIQPITCSCVNLEFNMGAKLKYCMDSLYHSQPPATSPTNVTRFGCSLFYIICNVSLETWPLSSSGKESFAHRLGINAPNGLPWKLYAWKTWPEAVFRQSYVTMHVPPFKLSSILWVSLCAVPLNHVRCFASVLFLVIVYVYVLLNR